MNRIDRLFAITVLLQARRRVRAMDLAALFEVSERTIYRDIEALTQSGIPNISTPGEGYELEKHFCLPTIQLTQKQLHPFQSIRITKKHSILAINTRVYYHGTHLLEIQFNGQILA